MFHFKIIQVGETKDKNLSCLVEEYMKRLAPWAKIEVIVIKDLAHGRIKNDSQKREIISLEGEKILQKIDKDEVAIAMDERGKEYSSLDFADYLRKLHDRSLNRITFIIGGCFGLGEKVLQKAGMRLALSKFTFTHEHARLILFEQLYRALSIISGREYHY
jgi:23S rRNA (pseudouridine1915-N3)-methyltransferase